MGTVSLMVKKETAHFVLTYFQIHVNIKRATSFLTIKLTIYFTISANPKNNNLICTKHVNQQILAEIEGRMELSCIY